MGIKNVNSGFNKVKNVKRRGLHFFALLTICLLTFSVYNVSLIDTLGLKNFIQKVTSNWTPKPDDFGKIKFVNFSFNSGNNSDGIFIVNSPFKNYYVSNITETKLQVNGLGDVVVISPIDGIVQDVSYSANKCKIALSNSNVIVYLEDVDYACVSIGQKVSVKDKIAVSLNSKIEFSILCGGQYIQLPANGNNDTFFE